MTIKQFYAIITQAGHNANHFSVARGSRSLSVIYERRRFNTVGLSQQVINSIMSLFADSRLTDWNEIIIPVGT